MNHESRALTALLNNKDMMSALAENAGDLFVSHKDIWDFTYDYYRINKEVPPPKIIGREFEDFEYDPEQEGSTKYYLQQLREIRNKQALESIIAGAAAALAEGKGTPTKILDHLTKRLADTRRNAGLSRSVDVRDIDDAAREFDRRRELALLHNGQVGIPTGFKEIDDNYMTGFAPGHFVVMLGYSGLGKTWFAIKIAINAWLNGYKPLMICLEMTPEELRDRIYFLISHYNMDDLVKAEIDPGDFERWAKAFMADKVEFSLVGNEGFGAFTTDMVAGKLEQYKPDLVICDYLQLFSDRAMSTQEVSRAKNTAREFKEIAMVTQIPVIVISAVTGKDKKDRLAPPSIAQVAWSSEIEYAANLALAVHTHRDPITQKNKETQIVCLKNRHGGLFSFNVKMDFEDGTIEEIPVEEQLAWVADDNDPLAQLDREFE